MPIRVIGVSRWGGKMPLMADKKAGRKKDPDSKRSQGVDRHTMPRVVFHAPEEMVEAFGKYVAGLRPRSSDAAALRYILGTFLQEKGYLPKDFDLD